MALVCLSVCPSFFIRAKVVSEVRKVKWGDTDVSCSSVRKVCIVYCIQKIDWKGYNCMFACVSECEVHV